MGYKLRVYGAGGGVDEEHDGEQEAITSGRTHLGLRSRPAFAEVRHPATSATVWTAYIDANGALSETYEREPGAD